MRFEQQIWRDRGLHLVGRVFCKARLRMLAGVGVGPAVEPALLDTDEIVGDELVAEAVTFLNDGVEVAGVRLERERGRIARSRREGRLVLAVPVEALDRRLWFRLDPKVSG